MTSPLGRGERASTALMCFYHRLHQKLIRLGEPPVPAYSETEGRRVGQILSLMWPSGHQTLSSLLHLLCKSSSSQLFLASGVQELSSWKCIFRIIQNIFGEKNWAWWVYYLHMSNQAVDMLVHYLIRHRWYIYRLCYISQMEHAIIGVLFQNTSIHKGCQAPTAVWTARETKVQVSLAKVGCWWSRQARQMC